MKHSKQPQPTLCLLAQGGDYVVVDKPAGIVTVAGPGVSRPTLMDLLVDLIGEEIRPVHRLDRVTYGCCLFARGLAAQRRLSQAFRVRQVDKRYLALVEGCPSFDQHDIDLRLRRCDTPDAKKGPLAHQEISERGKPALTSVRVWQRGKSMSVVEARPRTGRMHQIRVHLAAAGHPVVGDRLYGGRMPFAHGAIALLAFGLAFPIGPRKWHRVTAPLPQAFTDKLREHGMDVQAQFSRAVQGFARSRH
ncbi:MAG: RNA pseudouridine synthase [Myxococcota bacterium]